MILLNLILKPKLLIVFENWILPLIKVIHPEIPSIRPPNCKLRKCGINVDGDCPIYHKVKKILIIYLNIVIWLKLLGKLLILTVWVLLILIMALLSGLTYIWSLKNCYHKITFDPLEKTFTVLLAIRNYLSQRYSF